MNILVTGCSGFIGYHLCLKLLNTKNNIYGLDNLNNYYDLKLKKERLKNLKRKNFFFEQIDITNKKKLNNLVKKNKIQIIYHLAAQAGVRYSILNPSTYFDNNLKGFFNILETSRENKVKHLIFASTSSVYGKKKIFPLNENDNTDQPLSFYAATKKCNEIMAYSYSEIYKLKCTGVRFFTVYGPYGRPDMALYKFSESLIRKKWLNLFNKGNHTRDFTYIDDVIHFLEKMKNVQQKNNYCIYNLCSSKPIGLMKYLNEIEKNLQSKAKIKYMNLQKGDVIKTHGDNKKIIKRFGKHKFVSVNQGVKKFTSWFKSYK